MSALSPAKVGPINFSKLQEFGVISASKKEKELLLTISTPRISHLRKEKQKHELSN